MRNNSKYDKLVVLRPVEYRMTGRQVAVTVDCLIVLPVAQQQLAATITVSQLEDSDRNTSTIYKQFPSNIIQKLNLEDRNRHGATPKTG